MRDVTHLVFPDNVPLAVSGPVLAEVGVVMVVVHPVLEAEGVGLLVLVMARRHMGGHGGGLGDTAHVTHGPGGDDTSVTQRPD